VQGGQPYVGDALRKALERAEKAARTLATSFISVEHLLLALADPGQPGDVQRAARPSRGDAGRVTRALAQVRGGHRVTDANPEDKYQALANTAATSPRRAARASSIR
jgi:ATP-dependent Clp protease ATP-binding subunit ClpB